VAAGRPGAGGGGGEGVGRLLLAVHRSFLRGAYIGPFRDRCPL
jgi:hypothetical protein